VTVVLDNLAGLSEATRAQVAGGVQDERSVRVDLFDDESGLGLGWAVGHKIP
jgi:hypothetical protein